MLMDKTPQTIHYEAGVTSLTTHVTAPHPKAALIKFADDTTVLGLIHNGDESDSRAGVCQQSEC